ncbi:MAG: DHA2 family efflux MFS transporter permease subunit [Chloroflexi bacterium]|nr:MAG: DHA2 family efflux MFS transporter permease subunit [Chloroflexota bacterium]
MSQIRHHPMAALGVLALGVFMTLLDLTIVNIAIPSILDGLHASLDQVLWVLNAYSLLYAVLLITSARLGDIYGPRNLFAAGTVIFTAASIFSALAQDPTQLILSRSLQGLGAAVLAPQGMPLMLSLFAPEKRGGVFAIYGVLAGLAVIAGPTVGGFLVTHFGWRSIFTVNIPVGVITFALAMLVIPDLRPGRRHRLDLPGVALATAGLLCVIFGLIEGQRYDWGTVAAGISIPEIIAAGVVLLALFLYYQARRQDREPLLPFEVFKDRNFTLMTLVMAAMGFAILGIYLPLTIYMQSVLGLSAIDAGITLAIQPVAMFFSSGLAGGLAQKINGKYLLVPGLLMLAAGSGYIDWMAQADSGRWAFTPGLIVSGLGMGFIWTPVFSIATRDLPAHLGGVASGVVNTIQELGGVLASAVVGALLQNRLALALHDQAVAAGGGDRALRLHARFRRRHASDPGAAGGGAGRRCLRSCVRARPPAGDGGGGGSRAGSCRGLTFSSWLGSWPSTRPSATSSERQNPAPRCPDGASRRRGSWFRNTTRAGCTGTFAWRRTGSACLGRCPKASRQTPRRTTSPCTSRTTRSNTSSSPARSRRASTAGAQSRSGTRAPTSPSSGLTVR